MVCLGRTAVDDECLDGIAQMPRLRSVELYDTKITDEAVRAVEQGDDTGRDRRDLHPRGRLWASVACGRWSTCGGWNSTARK